MRRFLLGLVLLLGIAVIAAPFLLPNSVLRHIAEAVAERATGRTLAIDGEFALHPWPPLTVEASGVRFADAPWTERADMVRIGRLELAVDLFALLDGVLRVDRLALDSPSIVLERAADGRANWQLGEAGAPDGAEPAAAEPGGTPRILIGDVVITGGELRVLDRAAGVEHEVRDLDLRLEGAGGGTLALDMRALLRGEPLVVQGTLPAPERILAAEAAPLVLNLTAPGGSAWVEGTLAPGPAFAGRAEATFAELRRTLAWLAVDPGLPEGTFERLAFASEIRADPVRLSLSAMRLELDALSAEGAVEADLGRPRPLVEATLTTGTLALDPYLPEPAEAAEERPEEPGAEGEGWPTDPVEVPLPLPVDLAVTVEFAGLEARGVALGEGLVGVRVEDRSARVELARLALYGGRAEGELAVEAGAPHDLGGRLRVADVDLYPLLSTLAGFDRLEGTGNAEAKFATQGASVRDMVAALDGEGEVRLRDGAIRGVDIGAMVRRVTSLGRAGGDEPQKTDFAELGGTFVIADGILTSEDVTLRAPLLRLTAKGRVDLPRRTLDWRIDPRVASTLEGQGATGEPTFQAGVPIRLEGPWADPGWSIEFGDGVREVLGDPGRLETLVEGLRGRTGGAGGEAGPGAGAGALQGKIGGALGSLIGPGAAPATEPPAPSGEPAAGPAGEGRSPSAPALPGPAGDLLRGLIGR